MTAAILMGAGGFNFYDGIIQHAILHLHLVNEYVCNLAITHGNCPQDIPYEIVWDILGFALLAAGYLLWRHNSHALRNASEH